MLLFSSKTYKGNLPKELWFRDQIGCHKKIIYFTLARGHHLFERAEFSHLVSPNFFLNNLSLSEIYNQPLKIFWWLVAILGKTYRQNKSSYSQHHFYKHLYIINKYIFIIFFGKNIFQITNRSWKWLIK